MCYMVSVTVGVRELRQNLSVYLDKVKKGRALLVTEHGRVVARLAPLEPESDPVARLLASGAISPARRKQGVLPKPLNLKLQRPLSAVLNDQREDKI